MVSSKGTLSEAQKLEIQAMAKKPADVIDAEITQAPPLDDQYDPNNPFNE